ncbi:MAG: prepilin peptidase [Bdellovibrionales bacterium]
MELIVLTLTSFHLAVLLIAAAVFVATAVSDVRSYRIPNYFSGILLLLFPVYVATSPLPIDWHQNIVVFSFVALISFSLFWFGLMGAGDVKLLSVASLWAGPSLIAVLLVIMALTGGIQSLVVAAVLGLKRSKNFGEPCLIKAQIPYGVAIATGGVTMLGLMARPVLLSD